MEKPKKKLSKTNAATRQDSLNVYNSSVRTASQYIKTKFKGKKAYEVEKNEDVPKGFVHQDNDRVMESRKLRKRNSDFDPFLNKEVKHNYRNTIDSNRYTQKEAADVIVNTSIPGQLFDRRIEPRASYSFWSERISKNSDAAIVYSYNSIANKPFDLLTDKEKEQRVKKFGRSGVPDSYQIKSPGVKEQKSENAYKSEKQYKKTYPPIYLTDKKDPRINQFTEKGNQYLYKEPVVEKNKPLTRVNSFLVGKEVVKPNNSLDSSVDIKQPAKTPIAYEVEETSTMPFGSHKTNYTVSDPGNLTAGKTGSGSERKIIVKYADGGKIDPPSKSEKEWLKNWYNKRKLQDENLNKDYQIDKSKYLSAVNKLKPHKEVENLTGSDGKTIVKGRYDKKTNQASVLKGEGDSTVNHELTHGVNYDKNVIKTKSSLNNFVEINKNVSPREKVKDQWSKDNYDYMSNYQEVMSRINAYRKINNIQPTDVITKDKVKSIRDSYNSNSKNKDYNIDQLHEVFDDENLSNVLNKVTLNSNLKNKTNQAAFGGSFDSKKNIDMKSNWISKYSKKQNKMSDGTDLSLSGDKSSWNTAPSTAGVVSASAGIGTDLIGAFKKQGTGINDPLIKRQSVGAEAGKKALQYGAMGAAAGPWGAAIGAGVGAIVGGISALSNNNKFNEQDTNIRDNMTNTKGGVFADVIQKASGGNLFGEEEYPFSVNTPDFGDKDIFRRAKREFKVPTNTFGTAKSVDDLAKPYINNYDFSKKSDALTGKKENYFKKPWDDKGHYENLVKSQGSEESKKDSDAVIDQLRSVGLVADAFALQQANKEKAPVLRREGIVNMVPRGRVYDESFVANNINKNAYASQQMALANSGGSKAYARASQKISSLDEATKRAAMYAKVFEMNDASKMNYDTNNQKAYESRVNTSNEDMVVNMASKAQVDKRKLAYRDNMIKSVRDFASEMADKKEITKLSGYRPNDFKYMTPDKRKEALESYIAFKKAKREASV